LKAASQPAPAWLNEEKPWGAWHVPSQASHQESRCFSVALRSNSYGARDSERDMDGRSQRTIVLGDSFAEGWGVEAAQRASNLLEARLNREFLNFGTENDFGPLQYQILYEQFASHFSHDHVLILFLPDNDFTDNDASYWARFRPDYGERYRPYYQTSAEEGYRPFYPVPSPLSRPIHAGIAETTIGWMTRNTWSAAVYRYVRLRHSRPGTYSGYFDFTAAQLNAVLWSFERIKAIAGSRRVTVVAIPRRNDFARVAESGKTPLHEVLSRFGRENDIEIVDLLEEMPRLQPDIERYYLSCDGHWSAEGNAIAAQALAAALWPGGNAFPFAAAGAKR
jgi:lysophospholipase L1-like esterase